MIVTFTNNKGGTGKSTYSSIIAQLASSSGLNVIGVDLDHAQMHFSLFMRFFKTIHIFTSLSDVEAKKDAFIVVDTPPAFSDETLKALKQSDVIVVPINRDKTGILGLQEVASHIDKNRIIVVTSQWRMNTRFNTSLYEQLQALGWIDPIEIPENILIIHNRDANKNWDYGISAKQAAPYLNLLKRILKIAGGFSNGG
ncbi:MAG: ParA family protein [Prevotellaceae bacterium]|jgi:cellulose biosynthesis protein BcsQ|nr:ParA family protein [Prevotellaceae bacterium]